MRNIVLGIFVFFWCMTKFKTVVILCLCVCLCSKGHSDNSSNSSTTTEVKPNSSPALSPASGILSLINTTTSRPSNKPADGNISVKPDVELKTEGKNEQ